MSAAHVKKNDVIARFQQIADATGKQFAKKSLVLGGTNWKATHVVDRIESQIGLLQAADAARAGWLQAVADQRKDAPEVRTLVHHLQQLVAGTFGEASATYKLFGFVPRKPGKRTVESKSAAVVKSRQTRAARHTMGRKQRLSIKAAHGTLAAAAPNASLTVSSANGVTMTGVASASTANGVAKAATA